MIRPRNHGAMRGRKRPITKRKTVVMDPDGPRGYSNATTFQWGGYPEGFLDKVACADAELDPFNPEDQDEFVLRHCSVCPVVRECESVMRSLYPLGIGRSGVWGGRIYGTAGVSNQVGKSPLDYDEDWKPPGRPWGGESEIVTKPIGQVGVSTIVKHSAFRRWIDDHDEDWPENPQCDDTEHRRKNKRCMKCWSEALKTKAQEMKEKYPHEMIELKISKWSRRGHLAA